MSLVYRHRRLDTNKIFYIGVGRDLKRAYQKRSRNNYWKNIVSKTNYNVEILANNISQEDAFELEIFLIDLYGRIDIKTGCLCNLTDGGDGRKNIVVSNETRKKLSKTALKIHKVKIQKGIKKEPTRKQKVIDISNNIIYDTIIDASNAANITLRHFKRCLYGDRPNYTTFKLLEDKKIYKCQKKLNEVL